MANRFKSCSVEGCNGNSHKSAQGTRGWCSAHYQRWRRHGSPIGGGTSHNKPKEWIEHHVSIQTDECLTWPFATSSNGYAQLRVDGRTGSATREMCRQAYGEPPTADHEVAHSCGKGHLGCINPGHLRWATHSENLADKIMHGTAPRGENCGTARLTEDDVREIRRLKGAVSQKDLASRFGVSQPNISAIHSGRSWRWLDQADPSQTPT